MEPKLHAFLILLQILKSIKSELYADYADYDQGEDNYPSYVGNDDKENDVFYERPRLNRLGTDLSEHTMVTDSNVFPYMVTVLKGTKYLSSGSLIDESWVLTTADGLFLMGESIRLFRVRLGSINYKKGGVVMPIKLLEIHPYFDDRRPNFDLALLMLARPVRYTPNMKAIRIQTVPRDVSATHFIVTSWPGPLESNSKNTTKPHLLSMEMIKRHRILTVTHLHPADAEECAQELEEIGATSEAIMCLDPALKDPCMRDVGAPVVLNHILWAVISSWKPDDCDESSTGPVFATLVSATNVSSWIHATVHGHPWKPSPARVSVKT